MPRLAHFARASFMVLCLSAQTEAMAASHAAPIHVVCEDDRLASFCDELATALTEAQTGHPVAVIEPSQAGGSPHLTLRFETARFTSTVLSGHLVWLDRAGRSGSGPTVDLSVMDATIREPMLRDYARQLLGLTDLPL